MCQIISLDAYRMSRLPTLAQQYAVRREEIESRVMQAVMDMHKGKPLWMMRQVSEIVKQVIDSDGSIHDVQEAVERFMKVNEGVKK